MPNPTTVTKIMCLIANGVDETQFTEMQRALVKAGHKVTVVAPTTGVVQSWHGTSWGHFYPVDSQMGEVLGSDFDMLVLPGGAQAVAKLQSNLHTRRIVNHFLEAGKPVAAIGEAVGLLALSAKVAGAELAALPADAATLTAQQASVSTEAMVQSAKLLTAHGPAPTEWVQAALNLLAAAPAEAPRLAA